MDNETKLSSEQINSIITEAKSSDREEFIRKHLNKEQADKVKGILGDPDKLKAFLSSPFARQFMEKMKKEQEDK